MSKLVGEFKTHYFNRIEAAHLLGEFSYFVEENEDTDEPDVMEEDSEALPQSSPRVSIVEFLEKLKKASNCYGKIFHEKFDDKRINRRVNNLNRILARPTYIFLMHFMDSDWHVNTKLNLLRLFEAFMLRRHICEMRTSEHDTIISRMMKYLDTPDIIQVCKDHLMVHFPDDNNFEIYLPKHYFKGKLVARAKYVLEQIEYFKTGNTDEFTINQGNEVHLEHIIPETINTKKSKYEFGNWEEYLGNNAIALHKIYVHLIGNMTLLSAPLNISASNNPFQDKQEKYQLSNFEITNELVNLSDFKFDGVGERCRQLAKIACQIWTLN